ncbi:NAF1-domain-containing protein [Xylariaceae sp. FL0016]|nr:NAF1-domain-containing protein [Xylariaceae sp. FL0016]
MSGTQIPGLTTLSPDVTTTASQDTNVETTNPAGFSEDSNVAPQQCPPLGRSQPETKEISEPMALDQPPDVAYSANGDVAITDAPPSPPSLTSGLEALLGGLEPGPTQLDAAATQPDHTIQDGELHAREGQNGGEEEQGWEEDSSPYESSSDSSSSDDSDSDDSEDEKDYKILGPEETARILMEMDGGSDDEGTGKAKGGSGGQVRTKNELPKEIIPKPDIVIGENDKLTELGIIEHVISGDSTIVIKANTTGEYQVLDIGSAICLEDRTVIAAISDVIAAVRQPRYTADFSSEEDIKDLGLELGTKIFYPPDHAKYCFSEALRGKGTDASNWHDEEAGDDEVEFSDDEKEAEFKRQRKAKKNRGRGGRDGGDRGGRFESSNSAASTSLNYDDDDDGPYKKLPRPVGFGQGPPPAGSEEPNNGYSGHGGAYRQGRGDQRGRGRGRGGRGNRGGPRGGHSMPPRQQQDQGFQQPPSQQQFNFSPVPPPQFNSPSYPMPPPQYNGQANGYQNSNPQFPFAWPQPQNMPQGFVPPPPPQFMGQQAGASAYYNPAFYANLQNQMQDQGQYGQQSGQWPGQGSHG